MVRVVFNPSYTDGYKYDVSNQYVIASGTTNGAENQYSFTNQARTPMRIRVNLRSLFGAEFNNKEIFSIKLSDVETVLESGNSLATINQTSPGWIRTSNIVIFGPDFLGGNISEYIMGQATNFNPNEKPLTLFHGIKQIRKMIDFILATTAIFLLDQVNSMRCFITIYNRSITIRVNYLIDEYDGTHTQLVAR